jgi:membrane protein
MGRAVDATPRGETDRPQPPPAPAAPLGAVRHRGPLGVLRRMLGILFGAVDGFFRHHLAQHAAGIAYRILFSVAPLAIVLVSVLGLILRNASRRADVIDLVLRHLPLTESGARHAEDAVVAIASPVSALGFLSLFVFAWAASGMMASIRTGLEVALDVEQSRPAARAKLVDLLLVVGTAVLVLAVAGLSVVGELVRPYVNHATSALGSGVVDTVIQHLVALALFAVVVLLLYRFVPTRRIRFADAVAGALVTAVLLLAISLASGWVYTRANHLSLVYGSLTAALVFLYSVYLYACAVLFGAEFAAAWSRPQVETGEPFTAQVKRLAAGLFVHRDREPR